MYLYGYKGYVYTLKWILLASQRFFSVRDGKRKKDKTSEDFTESRCKINKGK